MRPEPVRRDAVHSSTPENTMFLPWCTGFWEWEDPFFQTCRDQVKHNKQRQISGNHPWRDPKCLFLSWRRADKVCIAWIWALMTLPACVTRALSVNQSHVLTQTVWSMRWQKGHSGWWRCVTSPLGVMHPASFLMTHTRIFDCSTAHKQKASANVFIIIPIWKTKQFIKLILPEQLFETGSDGFALYRKFICGWWGKSLYYRQIWGRFGQWLNDAPEYAILPNSLLSLHFFLPVFNLSISE